MYVRTRVGLSACFWLWVCYSLCRVECITSSSSCYAARVQCLDTACTGQHCHTHAVAAGPRMAVVGLMFIMFTVILVLTLTCHLALCKAAVIADVVLCMCAHVWCVCTCVCMHVRTYVHKANFTWSLLLQEKELGKLLQEPSYYSVQESRNESE